MADVTCTTLDGGRTTVSGTRIDAFDERLDGPVLRDGDAGYDEARTLWNAMIDRRPALIARCADANSVAEAVRFAREHDLLLAVRGGGHNIAGKAVCDGGLMIDLSGMKDIRVDPESRTARVEPGVLLQELDAATQEHGLATPVGYNSTTGIAGLTLGGGFGWLSRKYGLTIDNLLGADVVTADGERVRASADENPELFWGLRGGGGNFGVVTAFDFRLHPVGPDVLSGVIVYPHDQARDVLRNLRDFNAGAPDELTTWAVLRKAPPLPFLDEDVHGTDVLVVATCHAGDMAGGEKLLAPLRAFGDPHADAIGPHPYAGFQQAFDGLNPHGSRNYWKSLNFEGLTDEVIDLAVDAASALPSPMTEIPLAQLGGAISRVPEDSTAYPHRDAAWLMNSHTQWKDPADDEACLAWTRAMYDAMRPHAMQGCYVNFISEGEGHEREGYEANWDRLVALKRKVDPQNVFRVNQNVAPA